MTQASMPVRIGMFNLWFESWKDKDISFYFFNSHNKLGPHLQYFGGLHPPLVWWIVWRPFGLLLMKFPSNLVPSFRIRLLIFPFHSQFIQSRVTHLKIAWKDSFSNSMFISISVPSCPTLGYIFISCFHNSTVCSFHKVWSNFNWFRINQAFVNLAITFLGWYRYLMIKSTSSTSIFLYLFMNFINPILASNLAKCFPMHVFGPALNPPIAKAGTSSHSLSHLSGLNSVGFL